MKTPANGRRVLIVSPCATHPPDAGNRRRLLSLAVALRELGWQPVLLYTDLLGGDLRQMRAWWGEDFHFQPYRPGSLKWRLKRVVRRLTSAGSPLRKGLAWVASQSRSPAGPMKALCGPVDTHYEPALDQAIARLHAHYRFSAVIAEYILTSRALLCFDASVRKLVDTHEVFALGAADRSAPSDKLWIRVEPTDELEALRRADVALAIQDHDAATLSAAGVAQVVTFGHPVEVDAAADPEAALRGRQLLLVAAGHPFDVDGLRWFAAEVYPLLAGWLRPEDVVIAGGIRDVMSERPPFTFLGRVPDLAAIYRTVRVVMAPLRQGTGLKIKVVEALGRGKALVATSFGARGVEAGAGTALTLADTPQEFAEAIRRMMQDDGECRRLMAGALSFAQVWNEQQNAALRGAMGG